MENYNEAVIKTIDHYAENASKIALVEYGRGHQELALYLIEQGKEVTVIEDFKQTIYQADIANYKDIEDKILEHNILSTDTLDEKFDLIYCSLPNMIPNIPDEAYQFKLTSAFKKMFGCLSKNGQLLTVDYNTPTIACSIHELGKQVNPLIEVSANQYYMASVCCE